MTKCELPEPLVPPGTDVSDLDDFMLNVERLLASELVAIGSPEECWAAFMLWCRAWKQIPGGSLPDDDRVLASFSGAGKRWPKLREVALHGFVKCSDGRLYHRFLCGEVQRAADKKNAYRARREADRKRLSEWRSQRDRNGHETPSETRFVAEGTGTGTGILREGSKKKAKPAESESEAAGGRANDGFVGRSIRLDEHGLSECRMVYPFDDLDARLRIYDAKWADKAELGPLSRVLGYLAQDARRGRATTGPPVALSSDDEITRQTHLAIFERTGRWYDHWGPRPATNGTASAA